MLVNPTLMLHEVKWDSRTSSLSDQFYMGRSIFVLTSIVRTLPNTIKLPIHNIADACCSPRLFSVRHIMC